jgi:hypothetical protein
LKLQGWLRGEKAKGERVERKKKRRKKRREEI